MDCKTTNLTTQSTSDDALKKQQLCQQTFQSGDQVATEKYTYEKDLLVKTERFNSKDELLFTEITEWSDSAADSGPERMDSRTRKIGDKTVFQIRYRYENGRLTKQEIDDTNEDGDLVVDGKTDREELFFYGKSTAKTASVLTKITIERKNMPVITVDIEYLDGDLETKRTTRSDDKILEVQKTTYVGRLKSQSTVELRDGTRLEYRFSYDADGQLLKTTRSAANKTPVLIWSRQYDCKTKA